MSIHSKKLLNGITGESRLLILDDDPVMREIIAVLAERKGFDCRMVENATDFLSEIEKWKPTHVSIDLMMPNQDGIEVMRLLALNNCSAAIMIISGIDMRVLQSAKNVAIERGLNIIGVLNKPFKHAAFLEMLCINLPEQVTPRRSSFQAGLIISKQIIDEAIANNEFIFHYQPKINLSTGDVVGIEALLRWQHPLLGMVMPDSFIGDIEKINYIHVVTAHLVEKNIQWLCKSTLSERIVLAINLSALDISAHGLADVLHKQCILYGINPQRISLELTESSAMTHPDIALANMTRLRIKGFGLAIDDFGTGYSSMMQLARMPFSSMKIDKSFVTSMEKSAESRKIVSSIVSLGHALGLSVVAEGVETKGAAKMLHEMNCNNIQGYWTAMPMPPKDLFTWLLKWNAQRFVDSLKT